MDPTPEHLLFAQLFRALPWTVTESIKQLGITREYIRSLLRVADGKGCAPNGNGRAPPKPALLAKLRELHLKIAANALDAARQ